MVKKILIALLALVIILILPLLLKDRSNPLKDFEGVNLEDMSYDEITFYNSSDSILLAGMLFSPTRTDSLPKPIMIFIQGSGYSFRNNIWYLSIVKHLQDAGYAVLLPDKRGSEKSEGDWIGATPEMLATDTESAIQFIKSRAEFSQVGLLGVSQGGWIAPIVASKTKGVSLVVNMSTTLADGEEQLRFEEINNISQFTYKFIARVVASFTLKNLKKKASVAPFIGFDPIPYWKKVDIPTFFAYGENDTNAPVKISIELKEEHNLDGIKIKVYPDGRHAILDESKKQISAAFFNDLDEFLKLHMK